MRINMKKVYLGLFIKCINKSLKELLITKRFGIKLNNVFLNHYHVLFILIRTLLLWIVPRKKLRKVKNLISLYTKLKYPYVSQVQKLDKNKLF